MPKHGDRRIQVVSSGLTWGQNRGVARAKARQVDCGPAAVVGLQQVRLAQRKRLGVQLALGSET